MDRHGSIDPDILRGKKVQVNVDGTEWVEAVVEKITSTGLKLDIRRK